MGKTLTDRLLLGFNFIVDTESGVFRASKVSSIEQSLNLEAFPEGGVNGYAHALIRPQSELKKLIFERGCCEEYLDRKMSRLLGVRQQQLMTICIYDRSQTKILKTYRVNGWMVSKWKVSDLDAAGGGILLETVEVVYDTLTCEDSE
ncbi:T4-like virus tail tube protein gp19 [Caprobacter fermentans]|uniref:Phage tail protein n=1 Tax=Caproicibacter fermentans TaxID=2576756 RepID=A0A6N8HUQ7_9FIRM|nr:phage tail protein [Caproicibacter fermentans]MVB09368.1 T4-like virus tail tube protein gp19 [Caproicibacter fermentans]QNK40465.1 phage tail protein [Caproicibacter fermentans]